MSDTPLRSPDSIRLSYKLDRERENGNGQSFIVFVHARRENERHGTRNWLQALFPLFQPSKDDLTLMTYAHKDVFFKYNRQSKMIL